MNSSRQKDALSDFWSPGRVERIPEVGFSYGVLQQKRRSPTHVSFTRLIRMIISKAAVSQIYSTSVLLLEKNVNWDI